MSKILKWLRNERGASLLLVLMTLLVLSILGTAIATVSFAHVKLTITDRDYQSTYYIAEAGANQAFNEITTVVEQVYQSRDDQTSFFSTLDHIFINEIDQSIDQDFEKQFGEQPQVSITIEQLDHDNPRGYRLTAKGKLGQRSRTVEKDFSIRWIDKNQGGRLPIADGMAVMLRNRLYLTNGPRIVGDVYLDSIEANALMLNGNARMNQGKTFLPANADDRVVNKPDYYPDDHPDVHVMQEQIPWDIYQELADSFPDFPSYDYPADQTIGNEYNEFKVINNGSLYINSWQANNYVLKLANHLRFNQIVLGSNNTLIIDTQGAEWNIVLDHLDASNGHIQLIGGGTVNFFIKNKLTFGSASQLNYSGVISQLNLYYGGQETIILGGGQAINGSLFSRQADMVIEEGARIKGYLLSGGKQITYQGGAHANSFVIAPYAEVNLIGGANVSGALIADSLNGTGGVSVEYQQVNLEEFPFQIPSRDDRIGRDDLIIGQPIREQN